MPKVQVDDIQMYYEERGSGKPLVLITGLSGILKDWRLQTLFFSKRFRTVIFDNRGVGKSDKPKNGYSIRRFADDTVGLMDYLKIERAHILGLSMGGMIAQEIALHHPTRVDHLILCATNCGSKHSVMPAKEILNIITQNAGLTFEEIVRKSLPILFTKTFMRDQPQEVEKFVQDKLNYPTQTFHAFQGQLMAVMDFDSFDRLSQIDLPTLILAARGDVLVPPRNSEILAQKIRKSKLIIFKKGGHMFNIEIAKKFNEIVLGFLLEA